MGDSLQLSARIPPQRVDSIVGKMSPDEKLDYVGGPGFAIRQVPSAGLPAFEMSGADPGNYSVQIGGSSEGMRLRSLTNLIGEINLRIDQ